MVHGAALELVRHRVGRSKVDHVEGAQRNHLGDAGPGSRAQPVRPRREDAAYQLVAELGRGQVENPIEESGIDQALHRLSAGAGAMEDEHLIATAAPGPPRAAVTAGVVTPNIVGRHQESGAGQSRETGASLTMPAIAAAALARIWAEIELTPAISVTDAIIVMSVLPT